MPGPPTVPRGLTGLRVLHVVLKFSSGVGSAIAQYTQSVPEIEHHLLSGTPVDSEGDLADQAHFADVRLMAPGHAGRVRSVRAAVRELRPDIVHAHSSHGGVYARLAVPRTTRRLVYTPHCYSFERRDVPAAVRGAFWLAEALLAVNTTAFAACSAREQHLSAWPTRRAPRYLVPNIAPPGRPAAREDRAGTPTMVGGGRLSPQKDPAYFLQLVRRLREGGAELEALWLGDGDPRYRAVLEAGGVKVTGWLPRGRTLELLADAALYVHSALWEGFPLMVAEAVALRVPTLVRPVPSFDDVPRALTLPADGELGTALRCLQDSSVAALNVAGWSSLLRRNTLGAQREALSRVYGGWGG
jgi:glycosyltransferase involved in cell wall biosynthesis